MKNKFTLVTLALLLSLTAFAGGQKRKVLVIGMDGTRSDALLQANTPNIDSLVAGGFYTFNSWHIDITISGPSWSSFMTGVYHQKHGVTDNTYSNSNYWDFPYFPTRAKEIFPNLKCVQYTEWAPMSDNVYNDGWDQKFKGPDAQTITTGNNAVALVQDPDVDALFIYFDADDVTGHSSGFSPENPAYINAIEGIDVQVGRIMCALKSRPTYAQEDWLILTSTDHGGIGTGHGQNSVYERSIWWIGYSDRGVHLDQATVAPQCAISQTFGTTVEHDSTYNHTCDPGTYNRIALTAPDVPAINTTLQKLAPVQADIAVTALHHLIYNSGIVPDTVAAWNLDGKSWLHEMGLDNNDSVPNAKVWTCQTSGVEDVNSNFDFTLFANSSNNTITMWIPTYSANSIARIFNMQGQLVEEQKITTDAIKHNMMLNNMPHGNYVLQLEQKGKVASKEFNW